MAPKLFNLVFHFLLESVGANNPDLNRGIKFINRASADGVCIDSHSTFDDGSSFVIRHLDYADDTVNLAMAPEDASAFLEGLYETGEKIGLRLSLSKTKVVWLSGRPENPPAFTIGGQEVEEVEEFEYLGVKFAAMNKGWKRSSTEAAVKERCKKATKQLSKYRGYFHSRKYSRKDKELLIKTIALPCLYYGSETWSITDSVVNILNRQHHKYRLMILNRPRVLKGKLLKNAALRTKARRVCPRTIISRRRITFLTTIVATRNPISTFELLSADLAERKGKVNGGRAASHYLKTLQNDWKWWCGEGSNTPSLETFLREAENEYARLATELYAKEDEGLPEAYLTWDHWRQANEIACRNQLKVWIQRSLKRLWKFGALVRKRNTLRLVGERERNLLCTERNCEFRCAESKELNRHLRRFHQLPLEEPDQEEWRCPEINCFKTFKSKGWLVRHCWLNHRTRLENYS